MSHYGLLILGLGRGCPWDSGWHPPASQWVRYRSVCPSAAHIFLLVMRPTRPTNVKSSVSLGVPTWGARVVGALLGLVGGLFSLAAGLTDQYIDAGFWWGAVLSCLCSIFGVLIANSQALRTDCPRSLGSFRHGVQRAEGLSRSARFVGRRGTGTVCLFLKTGG